MSYNGVGLLTPRGSGTNGYVQRNLSHVTRVPYMAPQRKDDDPNFLKPQMRRTSRELIEHEHKRKVESELLVIAERLKAEGHPIEVVELKINNLRKKLQEKATASSLLGKENTPFERDLKEEENRRFADALGLTPEGTPVPRAAVPAASASNPVHKHSREEPSANHSSPPAPAEREKRPREEERDREREHDRDRERKRELEEERERRRGRSRSPR